MEEYKHQNINNWKRKNSGQLDYRQKGTLTKYMKQMCGSHGQKDILDKKKFETLSLPGFISVDKKRVYIWK